MRFSSLDKYLKLNLRIQIGNFSFRELLSKQGMLSFSCFIQRGGLCGQLGPSLGARESVPSRSRRPTDGGRVRASFPLHHSAPTVALEMIPRLYRVIQTGDLKRVPSVRIDLCHSIRSIINYHPKAK